MGPELFVDQADISLREFCKAAIANSKPPASSYSWFRIAVEENAIREHRRRINVTKTHAG